MADFDYDKQAEKWRRDKPLTIADFVPKKVAFDMFKKMGKGKTALDLGCGEGYFSRKMATVAKKVIAIDKSKKMISIAKSIEEQKGLRIKYHVCDVRRMKPVKSSSIDICVGNMITNYLKSNELKSFFREVSRVLKPSGYFILTLPHPAFSLSERISCRQPMKKGYDYIRSRDVFFPLNMRATDGRMLEIGEYHTTIEDHFNAISESNMFVTELKEPVLSKSLADKYPVFGDSAGKTVYMIIIGRKPSTGHRF